MTSKKPTDTPSAASIARAQRQRLAADERSAVMAEAEQRAVAVRKNMERLRALRQAKEAEDAALAAQSPPPPEPRTRRRK